MVAPADGTESYCALQTAVRIPIVAANTEEMPEASAPTRQDRCHPAAVRWRSSRRWRAQRGFGSQRIHPTRCLRSFVGHRGLEEESRREGYGSWMRQPETN